MGISDFDPKPIVAIGMVICGAVGAAGLALFLFIPLPWSFYGGLGTGVVLALLGVFLWNIW